MNPSSHHHPRARRLRLIGSLTCAVAGAAVLAAMLTAALATAAPTAASHTAAPKWLTWNAGTHTASLTLIADYTGAIGGYNFNGYGKGKMTVTVPVGAHVNVTFGNRSAALNHGFVITSYAKRTSTGPYPLAFNGASSTKPTIGTIKGKTEHHSFVAGKVGTYAILCAVPGHAVMGM
jgi:Sulfocyanin (SoxE) domain